MSEKALVTIVIPLYNQLCYLSDCLQSLINQTVFDWKTVVVDDASTDGKVSEVVESFRDSRITLLRHEKNRGLAAARNTGFRSAKTKWVLPMDADDKLSPVFLEKALSKAESRSDANAVIVDFYVFDDRGNEYIKEYPLKEPGALLFKQCIPGPGVLILRDLWEKAGGYCEDAIIRQGNEDWEFWISAFERGLNAVHLSEPLYLYRRHADSMMRRQVFCEYKTRPFIYRKHKRIFDYYHAGASFIFDGYHMSAVSYQAKKQKLKAVLLGFQAATCFARSYKNIKKIARFFLNFLGKR